MRFYLDKKRLILNQKNKTSHKRRHWFQIPLLHLSWPTWRSFISVFRHKQVHHWSKIFLQGLRPNMSERCYPACCTQWPAGRSKALTPTATQWKRTNEQFRLDIFIPVLHTFVTFSKSTYILKSETAHGPASVCKWGNEAWAVARWSAHLHALYRFAVLFV